MLRPFLAQAPVVLRPFLAQAPVVLRPFLAQAPVVLRPFLAQAPVALRANNVRPYGYTSAEGKRKSTAENLRCFYGMTGA